MLAISQLKFNNSLHPREPYSSGYGRRLTFRRSWVQIPVPYTGWTWHFFTLICCKKLYYSFEKTENNQKGGRDWSIFKNNSIHNYQKSDVVLQNECEPFSTRFSRIDWELSILQNISILLIYTMQNFSFLSTVPISHILIQC